MDRRRPIAWPESLVRNRLMRVALRHQFWRKVTGTIGPRYVRVPVGGGKMVLDLRETLGVSRRILKYGGYDPFITEMLPGWIAGGAAVDIGANIGYFTLVAARATTRPVLAFEPDPHAFHLLAWNVELNGLANARAIPKAAGDAAGKIRLYRSAKNAGDHRCYATGEARKSVEVDMVRADDELAGIEGVTFVKIDIQGFEERALRGMEGVLRRSAGVRILSEFEPKSIRAAGGEPGGYLDFLESLGFRWHVVLDEERRIVPMGREALLDRCGPGGYADLLFSRG